MVSENLNCPNGVGKFKLSKIVSEKLNCPNGVWKFKLSKWCVKI